MLRLNTATLRGFKMKLEDEVELAAKSEVTRAIEPWIDKMHQHATGGGSLNGLGNAFPISG